MKLEFYDFKSRAHPIRCMLHYFEIEFEDVTLPYDFDFKRWKLDEYNIPIQENLDENFEFQRTQELPVLTMDKPVSGYINCMKKLAKK